MADLAEWDSFYGIVGSAAGTLIGLQFVVMTLIAERPPTSGPEVGATFGTPTIVHFGMALLLSAMLRAPWHSIAPAAVLWGCMGITGTAYAGLTGRRVGRQAAYQPDVEDWLFHVVLPLAGYAMLVPLALLAFVHARWALFGVGAVTLLLLFVGIHNAWDSVAYQVFVRRREMEAEQR
jgi:hypothetical protein